MKLAEQNCFITDNFSLRFVSSTASEVRKNLSGLIYHEKSSSGGYLCYYKNLASDNPITYLCNVGCCANGCCALQEVKLSGSYNLVVILLLIFVFAILFTAVSMLVIYYIYNRKSDERGYEFSGSFTEDSVVGSQASGPPTYYGERRYLPHVNPLLKRMISPQNTISNRVQVLVSLRSIYRLLWLQHKTLKNMTNSFLSLHLAVRYFQFYHAIDFVSVQE
uniref:CX domain-containing protein n=1 Tax=Elaeophora elaphi TaxID=1147741 RepID=A0A0R3RW26_9BILA